MINSAQSWGIIKPGPACMPYVGKCARDKYRTKCHTVNWEASQAFKWYPIWGNVSSFQLSACMWFPSLRYYIIRIYIHYLFLTSRIQKQAEAPGTNQFNNSVEMCAFCVRGIKVILSHETPAHSQAFFFFLFRAYTMNVSYETACSLTFSKHQKPYSPFR